MGEEATQLEEKKLTLWELADLLKQADDSATISGLELAELRDLTQDKVDMLARVDRFFAAEETALEEEIKTKRNRLQVLKNQRQRMRTRIIEAMQHGGFSLLSGKEASIRLQDNPPSVDTDREPDAGDHQAHRDLVVCKLTYAWDKKAIAARLKSGEKLPWARLEVGKRISFGAPKKG